MSTRLAVLEGNEAAARIAHLTNEVIAIDPITPSSAMGEFADAWSAAGQKNLWGAVPEVFDQDRPEFGWAREQLASLLTPNELAAASRKITVSLRSSR